MDLDMTSQVKEVPDVRHRIRRLRWFKTSFRHHARLVTGRYGPVFVIDESRLTEAFLNWGEAFSANKSFAHLDRRDFVTYAAGLLLRELIRLHPVDAVPNPRIDTASALVDASRPIAQAWPDGFLYTNYCLCILSAVLEQEGTSLTLSALADDVRTWWSYRENAGEDPAQAIAFLDLFTGIEPNWFMPESVSGRRAMKRAIAARVLPEVDQIRSTHR